MSQRSNAATFLFFLAGLGALGDAVYKYTHGRGIDWHSLIFGVLCVAAGVYFQTVKRPV